MYGGFPHPLSLPGIGMFRTLPSATPNAHGGCSCSAAGVRSQPASAGVLHLVIDALDEAKAEDIRHFDVRKLTDITDFMIIANGTSHRHVHAMAERVREAAREKKLHPIGIEGEMCMKSLRELVVRCGHLSSTPSVQSWHGIRIDRN